MKGLCIVCTVAAIPLLCVGAALKGSGTGFEALCIAGGSLAGLIAAGSLASLFGPKPTAKKVW